MQIHFAHFHQTHHERAEKCLGDGTDLIQRLARDGQWILYIRYAKPRTGFGIAVQNADCHSGNRQSVHLSPYCFTYTLKTGIGHDGRGEL